jgi:hypothetical protein
LACPSPGNRTFELILSVAMIASGIYFFYGASRGRVFNFAAVIGRARILWTRIVATVLFVVGVVTLLSAWHRLYC